jgi:flagellar hook assembly protein FlgD
MATPGKQGMLVRRPNGLVFGLVFALTALVWPAGPMQPPAAAAAGLNPKVVVIAGPVGSMNTHYRADADAIAATARRYTSNVVLLKTPWATWSRVKPALQGASIVVYLGHGNGWPSIYAPYQPYTKNGLGLDPETGANGNSHVYYGEYYIARDIKLAPNAIVLFHHLCYASGNTSEGLPIGSLSDSKQRVDNYGAGFFAAGARAVLADVYHPHTGYITALFRSNHSINHIFHNYPTYHGNDIPFASVRTPGFRAILDPTTSRGPWFRSVIQDPTLTTVQVAQTAYPVTSANPAGFVVPGAAEVGAADGARLFTSADLSGDPSATLGLGTRLRLTAAVAPLADGTRVFAAASLDGTASGFVSATGLLPRDSTPPRIWTLDKPFSIASVDGTYPFALRYRASESIQGQLTVRNTAGQVMRVLTSTSDWTTMTWDLRDTSGALAPNGTYSWSLTAKDGWGNGPIVASGSATIDTTDPQSRSTVTGTLGQNGWIVGPATIAVSATDTGSGLLARRYAVDGGPTKPYSGPFVLTSPASHRVAYYGIDRAGNRETTRWITVRVDAAKPVTTPAISGPAGTNGWWTGPVSVNLAATDAGSGVNEIRASVDGGPAAVVTAPLALAGDGTHTLTYSATDLAGNREATKTLTVRIDSTRPTTGVVTMTGTPGGAGWYRSPVTLGFAGADSLSGLAGFRYTVNGGPSTFTSTPAATLSASGTYNVAYWAVDRAGNPAVSQSVAFKMDVRPPVSAATVGGPAGDAPGWYSGPVSVTLSATDDASGVTRIQAAVDGGAMTDYTGPLAVTADGPHAVTFRSTDAAGNVESTRTLSFRIDTRAPALTGVGAVPGFGTLSPNRDGVHEVGTLNYTMSEPGSIAMTIANASGTVVRTVIVPALGGARTVGWDGRMTNGSTAPDGTYRVTLLPRDLAGNVGAAVSTSLDVYTAFRGGTIGSRPFYPQDGDGYARTATVTFALAAPATVQLDVLDWAGRRIRTLRSSRPAGAAAVTWDGRTDSGVFAPQGRYVMRVTASSASLAETKSYWVVAQAFRIATSTATARRGSRLTVTVISAEPLSTVPRLVVRQPGIAAYGLTMTRVYPATYRVTFTVRSSATGTMSLTVSARDSAGQSQSSILRLLVR